MSQFYMPMTETVIEFLFHALLARDYMSSFSKILVKPRLNQSRPQC